MKLRKKRRSASDEKEAQIQSALDAIAKAIPLEFKLVAPQSPTHRHSLIPEFQSRPDSNDDLHMVKHDESLELHVPSAFCFCNPELTHLDSFTWRGVYKHKTQEELCQ